MESYKIIEFIRRNWLRIGLLTVLLIVLYLLSQFSFIKIQVSSANSSSDINYEIVNSAGEVTESKSKQTSFRKLVRRGEHSIYASQNESSYFGLVKAGGFLTTKTINAELKPEQARVFIGDNPDVCMHFVDGILLSLSCSGERRTLKVHEPANAKQPTYAKTPDESGDIFEGTVNTKQGTFVLVNSVAPDQEESSIYIATLDNQGQPSTNGRYIPELSRYDGYNMAAYKDGVIIYDDAFSIAYYMSSVSAQPEAIAITPPKQEEVSNYLVAASGDLIVAAYTDRQEAANKDVHESASEGSSTLVVYDNGQAKQFNVSGVFSDMEVCGTKKLCVLKDRQLGIYDISGKKPKLLYTLPNVRDITTNNQHLIAVTDSNILDIDVDNQNGYIAYSFGDYVYCGISNDTTGYNVCLIDKLERKVALRFDPNNPNSNSIDKKIAALQKSPAVSVVSIYRNFIFIAPNYGQTVYNPNTNIYDYEPATVKRMNEQLEKDLASLGLSRSTYTISGTQQ